MAEPLTIRTPLRLTFAAVLLVAAVAGLISNMQAIGTDPGRPEPADFNIFHLVGQLALTGRLDQAYGRVTMEPLERALTGVEGFMPWSYPPLFGLVLAPLAVLPLWLAQSIFVLGSLALFLAATWRLAGAQVWPIWLALAPCLGLNLQAGQNGLLTGGLVALAALLLVERRPAGAGSAIAALAIKPHLAVMFPVILVVERRWLTLCVAAIVAMLLTGISIAALGWSTFDAFLHSFAEVQRFMKAGAYPMRRMTSIYAAALSWGVPPGAALAMHGAVALVVLVAAARVMLASLDLRIRLGVAIAATTFISPYMYDYDATVLGVGFALLEPGLAERLPARLHGLLLTGLAASLAVGLLSVRVGVDQSVSGILLVGLVMTVLRVLGRPPAAEQAMTTESRPPALGASVP